MTKLKTRKIVQIIVTNKMLKAEQARVVAKVNAPEGTDIGVIVRKSAGGLRRVYTEIEKLKMA